MSLYAAYGLGVLTGMFLIGMLWVWALNRREALIDDVARRIGLKGRSA